MNNGVSVGLDADYQQNVVAECKSDRRGTATRSTRRAPPTCRSLISARLFGYNGLYDTFFREKLANLVDTSPPAMGVEDVDRGVRVGGSAAMLQHFQAAERIRQLFFRQGSQDPQLQFTLTPTDLDAAVLRFTLDVDGQALVYRHDAPRAVAATWPGPKPNLAVATFEERSGGRPNLVFEGPWAWLRMVGAARLDRESEVRYAMTYRCGWPRGAAHARSAQPAQSLRGARPAAVPV